MNFGEKSRGGQSLKRGASNIMTIMHTKKNPIIKLVSDRSTGREISCFENVYDESQLWGVP